MTLNRTRWSKLAARLEIVEPGRLFRQLRRRYGQRRRHYHNAHHINDCLAHLDSARHAAAADPLVEYALWFHDAIHNPFSSRNERRSADWAAQSLVQSGAGPDAAGVVYALIMATRHAHIPFAPAQQLVVDIDLAILGSAPARFALFERQIRAEYRWVPRTIYRRRRAAVLQSFARRQAIYATEEFRQRFEAQAQDNIRRRVAELNR